MRPAITTAYDGPAARRIMPVRKVAMPTLMTTRRSRRPVAVAMIGEPMA